MSGEKKKKINAVLARFEETIEQNNAVGVCSGMYLTTQVSKSSPSRAPSRRHSVTKGGISGHKSQRRMPCGDVKPGVYRDMLNGKPKKSAPVEGDADWDPFGNSDGNLDFPGDDPSNCSDDDDDDDASHSSEHKARLQRRPKAKGSAGRRGLRKTRTKGAASSRRKPETAASVDTCTTRPESDSEENNDDDDDVDDDDSSFSLTYVGDREKYASLQRQSSDKRLHASSTRLPRGGGLEMARQDSSSSLTRQRKSHHRSKALDNSGEPEDDSSFSASHSESPASPLPSKRGHHHSRHHHHHSRSGGLDSSRQRLRSTHGSSRGAMDHEPSSDRSSPQRRTTSSRKSTRNFGKSRSSNNS